jgi:hypothetical protein
VISPKARKEKLELNFMKENRKLIKQIEEDVKAINKENESIIERKSLTP